MVRRVILAIILWSWPATILASDAPRSVIVRTVEGDLVEGKLVSLSMTEGAVVQAGGQRRTVAADGWIRLTPLTPAEPAETSSSDRPVDEVTVQLSYGDRLVGRIVDAAKDALIVETADLGRVTVPLDDLASITTSQAGKAAHRNADVWFQRTAATADDAILLTNGDVVRGFITSIDAQGVTLDVATGPATVPYRLIVALRTVHPPPKPITELRAMVQLRDTSVVTARRMEGNEKGLELFLRCGSTVHARIDRVTRIECATPRWTWLTDLRPLSVEQVPMLGLTWDHQLDRNTRGGPLVVAGETFNHGIGVHARSVLVYELGGEYKEFVTAFGLDDDSGPYADVSVAILVDGRPRLQTSGVKRGALHPPIRMDVARAGRIELIVDFGENGDLQDRFNWIEPALIR